MITRYSVYISLIYFIFVFKIHVYCFLYVLSLHWVKIKNRTYNIKIKNRTYNIKIKNRTYNIKNPTNNKQIYKCNMKIKKQNMECWVNLKKFDYLKSRYNSHWIFAKLTAWRQRKHFLINWYIYHILYT